MFASWEDRQADGFVAVPIKELQYNRAPAVAPLGVLEQADGWARIGLDEQTITTHRNTLLSVPSFAENIRTILEKRPEFKKSSDPEAQLYDGFVADVDTLRIENIRQSNEQQLADLHPDFNDERLSPLLLHYKARNYPKSLAEEEAMLWETWRAARILKQLPSFVKRLQELSVTISDDNKRFILEELQLWAESIVPIDND
jgi:exodeoxyribonuclease-1